MAAACSPWDGNCLPPLLGEEEESSSGKCLEAEAVSKAVLSLPDKASCLERLWAGLFKGRADPQPPPSAYASPGWKGKVWSVSKDVLGGGVGGLQQYCSAWLSPHMVSHSASRGWAHLYDTKLLGCSGDGTAEPQNKFGWGFGDPCACAGTLCTVACTSSFAAQLQLSKNPGLPKQRNCQQHPRPARSNSSPCAESGALGLRPWCTTYK